MLGLAWQGRLGKAGRGKAGRCMAWPGEAAGRGKARLGVAVHGVARQGKAGNNNGLREGDTCQASGGVRFGSGNRSLSKYVLCGRPSPEPQYRF
jgi:hypothetical protein